MPAIARNCLLCEAPFTTNPRTPGQGYCSKRCQGRVARARNRETIAKAKKDWYEKNKERRKEYDRAYHEANKEKISKRTAEWKKANREHLNALARKRHEERKNDPAYLEARRRRAKEAYDKKVANNPNWFKERYAADEAFRQKVRARALAHAHFGKIHREPCEGCGHALADMHHDDYSKPTEVRWLCRPCHQEWHRLHPEVLEE